MQEEEEVIPVNVASRKKKKWSQ